MTETPDHSAPQPRTALIVLGMHRSGTSAMAGVVGRMGAALPRDLMAPAEMNARGFFESNRVTGLNDRLLAAAERSWWDPRPVPADWFDTPEAAALADEAVTVLTEEFGTAPLFVMKDPRICRLLPFWRAALDRVGAAPVILHIHRRPQDVAASLDRWAGYPRDYGLLLWARHLLDAEAATRDLPRVFVTFDGLMSDWRATVARVTDALAPGWDRTIDAAAPEIDGFLSADLQHFKPATEETEEALPPPVDALRAMADGWAAGADPGEDRAALDALAEGAARLAPLHDRLALDAARNHRRVQRQQERIAEQHRRAERQAREIARRTEEGRDLARRLADLDGQLHATRVQLTHLADLRMRDLRERLALGLREDDPAAMSRGVAAVTERAEARIAAMAAQLEEMRGRHARAEAERDAAIAHGAAREEEFLASSSWRVTAPMRWASRVLRGRSR